MDHINVDDVSPTSSSSQEDNEPVPCGSRIGTSDVQPQTQTSSQAASCVDGKKHSSEPNKAESTDNSLLALEQQVEEACALVERTRREREEREQVRMEIERKHQEIRERKRREREAMEQEEASRWPQQQEAITGRSQWLCEHYQRHCRVQFPCCSYFYSCHHCHNNSKACKNEEGKAHHATHLKCSFCQHEREIGEDSGKCRSCGAQMSAYFCLICKHFTSVDKNPYHCKKCGICRIHRDKSFHCEVCNVCLDKRLEGKHKCRPDSGHDECSICLEENQGQEGDLLEDQCALQTERIVDAVPGDGDGVDSDNERNPESESTCSEEDLSAMSNDAVLSLKATAAPRSREQIVHLENTVQERKKENQTLEALLKIAISRGDIPDLPGMNAVCDDSSTPLSVPAYRHFNTGVATNVPLEPSLIDVVQGIDAGFLARHSQDPHLCGSPQANVENTSLPEAGSNVASSSEDPVSRRWIQNPRLVPSENDCVCCENDGSQACTERCRPDSGHDVCCECLEVSSSEDPVFRQWIRNPCLVPSENDCVCCENDGSQACTERCRPDSGHDVCCECLEDVFNGLQFLPCLHHIHMDCLIDMIRNGALNCPLCGRAFLRRG